MKTTLAELKAGQDRLRDELRSGLVSARNRQERDFRITFGAIIAVALGLAAIMAKGFRWF